MRKSIKESIASATQGLLNIGLGTSFTEKELKELGVKIPEVKTASPTMIKNLRKKMHMSQSVFACILSVSLSSVRQWEQGQKIPSAMVSTYLKIIKEDPQSFVQKRMAS